MERLFSRTADGAEMPLIEGEDLTRAVTFGEHDVGGVSETETQVSVLQDYRRDARNISG